eukprot:PLAT10987.1.p1 GENE.PLAT10987.1~~PLAT10987.1.p1  ORF type:complete len:714 (+),score=444.93 PLAT10987.1:82-2142(+)
MQQLLRAAAAAVGLPQQATERAWLLAGCGPRRLRRRVTAPHELRADDVVELRLPVLGGGPKKKKKRKKKKKSKEELEAERRAREEEERRIAEEERKAREEEERRRAEEERRRLAEEARARAVELKRLQAEEEQLSLVKLDRAAELAHVEEEESKEREWAKFLACSHRPDASSERELNTHLSTWALSEERELEATLSDCQFAELICRDLEVELATALARDDGERAALCRSFLDRLRDMAAGKVDRASAHILQHSDEFATPKNEVMVACGTEDLRVGIWVNLASKGFRMKTLDFPGIDITTDIPKPLALQSVAVRVMYYSYDHVDAMHAALDMALGGIFYVEVLALPPIHKRVKSWTLRQVTPLAHSVQRLAYPLGAHGDSAPLPSMGAGQTLRIKYNIPPHVMVRGTPRVGWWDASSGEWNEDGINEIFYYPSTRQLSFHTLRLTALALIQKRNKEFPYAAWELTPTATDTAQLTLTTPNFAVTIDIGAGWATLVAPMDPELDGLRGQQLPPGVLLRQLAKSGLNLLPIDADASSTLSEGKEDVYIAPKAAELEKTVIDDVCRAVAAFTLGGSRWNQGVGASKAVLRVRETLDFGEGGEDRGNWETVIYQLDEGIEHGVKCAFVASKEDDRAFSGKLSEGEETHTYLAKALPGHCTPEALDRLHSSSVQFQESVKQIMHLLRLLSFS